MTAKVIILNGVSSSGKSSLARAIQQEASSTFLHIEMDKFISFLPAGHELRPEWFELEKHGPSDTGVGIKNGPKGAKLLRVMRQFVHDAAEKGLDMVVDEVCEAAEIEEYRSGLADCNCVFAKVFAPIEVIERRERERGDRMIGLARGQSAYLHRGIVYDIEVNTSVGSVSDNAKRLLARLK